MKAVYLDYWDGRIDLPDGESTLGRDPSCTLTLQDGAVSRKHLRFHVRQGLVRVEELDSTNGTLVNGQPLAGPRAISDGDVLQLGRCVLILRHEGNEWGIQQTDTLDVPMTLLGAVPSEERRTGPRVATSFPVRFFAGESGELDGVAWNLSQGGMFIACKTVDPTLKRCEVVLMPRGEAPMTASGVVCHVVPSATMQGHPPGVGICFEDVAADTARWLSQNIGRGTSPFESTGLE